MDNKSTDTSSSASDLTRRQKHLNLVIDHFWNRWRREYLTELREHHRGRKESETRRIKQGDVVCIHENSVPRQNWKVTVIQSLIHGRDGCVRAASVRLAKEDKCVELRRPVERLYPIEVPKDHEENPEIPAIKFVSDEQVENIQGLS